MFPTELSKVDGISPILFCMYIDGLLHELENSFIGCYMGGVFGDDLKLLTPSVNALIILVDICKNFAAKYNVKFNAKKSLLIIYKCIWGKPPDPNIYTNNVKVPRINEVIISVKIYHCIFKFNASKYVADFNRQCNMYVAHFKYTNSNIRNVLFLKYQTTFYGIQVRQSLTVVWKKFILHRE